MIRTLGAGEAVASRTAVLAQLLRTRGHAHRVTARTIARRLNQRNTITATEVRAVAAANPTLVNDDGSGNLLLTNVGLQRARERPLSRWALR
jgi:hypothetical protein